jgi:hypothetical protein
MQKTGSEHASLPVFLFSGLQKNGEMYFFHPDKYNPRYNLQTMNPGRETAKLVSQEI